jgi:dUTP pyrophosphatase
LIKIFYTPAYRKSGAPLITAPRKGDAGFDFYAPPALRSLAPHETGAYALGFATQFDDHLVALVKDRSSVAVRGLRVTGTIDSGWRDEWVLTITNTTPNTIFLEPTTKIAQFVLVPFVVPDIAVVDNLSDLTPSERGAGGFGSTNPNALKWNSEMSNGALRRYATDGETLFIVTDIEGVYYTSAGENFYRPTNNLIEVKQACQAYADNKHARSGVLPHGWE